MKHLVTLSVTSTTSHKEVGVVLDSIRLKSTVTEVAHHWFKQLVVSPNKNDIMLTTIKEK